MELYIADSAGNIMQAAPFKNAGWANWQRALLTDISLESGTMVTAGVKVSGGADDWGTLDDFALYAAAPQRIHIKSLNLARMSSFRQGF